MLIAVLSDCSFLNTKRGLRQDIASIRKRVKFEGLPFVTVKLPSLGKALETALETGTFVVPDGFKRSHRYPGLTAILQDVLIILFDGSGSLRSSLNWIDTISDSGDEAAAATLERAAAAVRLVRQISYLCYKLEVPRPEGMDDLTLETFVREDNELPEPDTELQGSDLLDVAKYEIARVLQGFDPTRIRPRHGPGAVSTRERGPQKWAFKRLYQCLSHKYDLSYFTAGGAREFADRVRWHEKWPHAAVEAVPEASIVVVNKDSRGGRVILPQPLELMFIGSGLGDALSTHLSRGTSGRIQFRDQTINGRLALASSRSRLDATLDLKNASNWVSWALVRYLMPATLVPYLEAVRSTVVRMPNGKRHTLKMHAPMGSALCFPIEALVFWAIAVSAIAAVKPGQRQWIRMAVRVFGDDIIVPRQYAGCVMDALEAAGLKVNRGKSFIHGFFRESCGVDAFAGYNVTPVKLKKLLPTSRTSFSELISLTRVAANLAARGLTKASELAYREVERHIGDLPYGTAESGFLCRVVGCVTLAELLNRRDGVKSRVNFDLQRIEYQVLRPKQPEVDQELDGYERLLRNLLSGGLGANVPGPVWTEGLPLSSSGQSWDSLLNGSVSDPGMMVDLNRPCTLVRTWAAL
jgi:hypothetical protein